MSTKAPAEPMVEIIVNGKSAKFPLKNVQRVAQGNHGALTAQYDRLNQWGSGVHEEQMAEKLKPKIAFSKELLAHLGIK